MRKSGRSFLNRAICMLLALLLVLGSVPLSAPQANAAGGLPLTGMGQNYPYGKYWSYAESSDTSSDTVAQIMSTSIVDEQKAQTASFITRSDGVWFWPLPQSAYNSFTDWAGCNGNRSCMFHSGNNHGGCVPAHNSSNGYGHNGIDVGVSVGTSVYAAADGTLYCTSTDWSSRGITAIVEHPAGYDENGNAWSYYSIYQHLNSVVSALDQQKVNAGDRIAYSGKTDGYGTGAAHLHFGIVLAKSGLGYSMSRNPNSVLSAVENKGWVLTSGYKEGRIMPNPALNSPAGYPTGNSAVVPNLKSHAGPVMYTFNKAEVEISCIHSYTSTETAPTCANAGMRTYTCSKCGDSYTETIAATGAHSYGSWTTTKNATCTEVGYQQKNCATCSATQTQTISAKGHSYGNWTTTSAATCTEGGVQKSTCSACGDVKTQTIPATGHIYTATVIDANCVEYAKTVYLCTECGHSYEEYEQGAYSDWSTEKPNGIAEELIESRTEYRYQAKEYATGETGTMDGWTLYDTTTQWGDYGNWSAWSANSVTASDTTKVETRTAYGYYYYKCSSCGAHMHGYGTCYTWAGGCGASTNSGDWREVWSATPWDTAGLKDWHGTGKYYTYIDGQLVFKWNSGGSEKQYRYCTREQETVYNFYRWSDWSDWSASAVEVGDDCKVETRTVYRYVESGLGDHKYISVVTAPSCTEQGYTTYSCSVCGESYKSDYTAALDHSYSYKASKAPTASAAGTLTGTCSKCSGTTTVTLPKLNTTDYTYKVTKEPSYTATGTGRYTWRTTTYGTFYFEVTLDKLTATLTKIEVATSPTKTVYELGESLNTAGLVLKLTYSDGATKTVTTGFTTTGFDFASAGTKTVTVSYGGKTTTFAVTVKAAEVDENAPQIVLENKTVVKGNTVTMNLELKNNPGFCALQIAFLYDTEYLTLTSVKNQVPSMVLTSGSAYVWDAAEDYSEDGTLAVLTFEVDEDALEGDYEIQVYFMGASNADFEEVEMTGVSGVLTVSSIVYGDANGDGKVTTVDLAMLRRYLAAMDPITGVSTITVQAGADVNGDGSIGTVDLAMLRRYLAAMDPITGESTIVLGPR